MDVDVDSKRLQNRYVQTESHLLQRDIGRLINDNLSPSEVTQAIGRLLPGEKYAFLNHHAVPSQSHVNPRIYHGGRIVASNGAG